MTYSKTKAVGFILFIIVLHLTYGSVLAGLGAIAIFAFELVYAMTVMIAIYSFVHFLFSCFEEKGDDYGYRAY